MSVMCARPWPGCQGLARVCGTRPRAPASAQAIPDSDMHFLFSYNPVSVLDHSGSAFLRVLYGVSPLNPPLVAHDKRLICIVDRNNARTSDFSKMCDDLLVVGLMCSGH